jgi:ABC-type transport system involved in multi-copper enzyme maturation permease subunit
VRGALFAIAANTVRDAVRNKVLYILVFFALLMIGTSVLLATLSYVERARILQDVGIAAIRFFGAAIAIFMGVGLIHREVERRTIYTILSKPVTRACFLAGKYLGLVATVWLQLAVMGAAFAAVSLAAGAPLGASHALAFALVALELAVVVAFATLFSAFATPFLAASYSVGLYLVGHLTRDLRALGAGSDSEAVEQVTLWIHRLLPDLSALNRSIEAVHGLAIPPDEAAFAALMGVAWCLAFLGVAVLVFERRDFR